MSDNKKNTWSDLQKEEAGKIIARGEAVQKSRNLSDAKMVTEFPDLGSAKTWSLRLSNRSFTSLNPERTLERLRRFAIILDGGYPDAIFYKDLPFSVEVLARVKLLERSTTDRRILVILAPNGCGKTTTARWLVHQSRTTRAYVRIRPSWRNKAIHLANGIAEALGAETKCQNAAEAEQLVISLLLGHPRTVFIDQAHEGGPALMHLLRSLVDETLVQAKSRFVYLGYDTAFRRVQCATTDAMIEAQAFMGRCLKPIFDAYKFGTRPSDVCQYLMHAADLPVDVAKGVATRVTPAIARSTNLRLLDDAIESARKGSEEDEANPELIVSEVFRLSGLDSRQFATAEEKEAA
jgi:hypothetical protein